MAAIKKLLVLTTLLAAALAAAGCRRGGTNTELTVAGSTSIQPFADKWAEVFMEERPGLGVNVQGGGSSAGIQACKSGACQIGMSSRDLKPDEQDLHEIVVAFDGLAVIVHPDNPVRAVSLFQIKGVFSGQLRNWRLLGGPDRQITVVTREEGSGTRGAFQELVMGGSRIFKGAITQDSNGTVREIVAHDPYAIGFISLGLVNEQVAALELDGAAATDENIESGRYKLVRPFLFVSRGEPTGQAKDFIDFVLSDEGQALIKAEGLIPVKRDGPE